MRALVAVSAVVAIVPSAACFYTQDSPLPADFGTCAAPIVADDGLVPDAPTWFRDVEPIVIRKCQGCHTDGGIAPVVLADYGDVARLSATIYGVVESRAMPPWQPDRCCNAYQWDRSLSEEDRATMLRWIELGLAAGAPEDAPPVDPPGRGLPRVDLRAVMAVPFTPEPRIGADELRCFLLDHDPIDRTRYITGFDFLPGVRSLVHHVTVSAIEEDHVDDFRRRDGEDGRPGWDCHGDSGELVGVSKYIGGWQPGVQARVLPAGIGRELPPRTRIMLSVHYDTGNGVAADQSALELMLEDRVDRLEKSVPVGNPAWFAGDGLGIAADDPDAVAWFAYDPTVLLTKGKPIDVHNVMVHMHELGSIGRVAVLRADGTSSCLLNITAWDFHWMADYYFAAPVRIEPGDKLVVECHWDNTAGNQKIVDGVQQAPRDLHWSTDEEMCGAIVIYSQPVDDA